MSGFDDTSRGSFWDVTERIKKGEFGDISKNAEEFEQRMFSLLEMLEDSGFNCSLFRSGFATGMSFYARVNGQPVLTSIHVLEAARRLMCLMNRELQTDRFRISPKVCVSQDDLTDIMTTAIEGGIVHWCQSCVGHPNANISHEQVLQSPAEGKELSFRTVYGESFILTREKLLEGIEEVTSRKMCNPFREEWTSDVDAYQADAIIQFALFKELRYC